MRALEGLLRVGLGADRDREAVVQQRQVLLVGLEEDPDLAQVGDGHQRLERLDERARRHLAVDHAAVEGGAERPAGAASLSEAPSASDSTRARRRATSASLSP